MSKDIEDEFEEIEDEEIEEREDIEEGEEIEDIEGEEIEDIEEIEDEEENVEDEEDDKINFYDNEPKKAQLSIKNRKRPVAPKVQKRKEDDVIIINDLIKERRNKGVSLVGEKTERSIYNFCIREYFNQNKIKLKSCNLNECFFKNLYYRTLYEVLFNISQNKEVDVLLKNEKIGLNSDYFKNEIFNDKRETLNIENPPKVMSGIHTCSVCIKDESRKTDTERGKRIDWYQQQTRSCDEPMTTFLRCVDCGKKWKF